MRKDDTQTPIGLFTVLRPRAVGVLDAVGVDLQLESAYPLADCCLVRGIDPERLLRAVESAEGRVDIATDSALKQRLWSALNKPWEVDTNPMIALPPIAADEDVVDLFDDDDLDQHTEVDLPAYVASPDSDDSGVYARPAPVPVIELIDIIEITDLDEPMEVDDSELEVVHLFTAGRGHGGGGTGPFSPEAA